MERIVDGDTIWVRVDDAGGPLVSATTHKIRLLEIDTPEVGECWANEATKFLTQEISVGSTIYVLSDKEDKDRYGRFLRYIWDASGEFINLKVAREGHAKAVLFMPNDLYINDMRAAAEEAKRASRGLWGACTKPPPPPPQQNPPPSSGSNCHPSYEGVCIPKDVEDADCEGGSGNGPYYVKGPFRVVGPDVFDLDRDKDGIGCE